MIVAQKDGFDYLILSENSEIEVSTETNASLAMTQRIFDSSSAER